MQQEQMDTLRSLTGRQLRFRYIQMVNGGFQLYSPRRVYDVYEKAFDIAWKLGCPKPNDFNGDQGILTMLIQSGELGEVQMLPEDFNYLAPDVCPAHHWIMHAHAGTWKTKVERMDNWYEDSHM